MEIIIISNNKSSDKDTFYFSKNDVVNDYSYRLSYKIYINKDIKNQALKRKYGVAVDIGTTTIINKNL